MRLLAIVPTLMALTAMILSILCIFAGTSTNFMSDYSIIALNTSRIGQNIVANAVNAANKTTGSVQSFLSKLDPTDDDRFANRISAVVDKVAQPLQSSVKDYLSGKVTSLAQGFGLDDFYAVHLINYCEGTFTPTSVPNATVRQNEIKRNVSECSDKSALFRFDPKAALEQSLQSKAGNRVTLDQLGWPEEIDEGIEGLAMSMHATFALYCVGAGLAFVVFVLGIWWFVVGGRASALWVLAVSLGGFLALLLASIIITVVSVKGDKIIDKHGEKIGVEAIRGNRYLGLTWSATALLFLTSLFGVAGLLANKKRRAKTVTEVTEK